MNNPHISIRQLEPVLGFSRQGYYQYWQRQAARPDHDAQVVSLVRAISKEHRNGPPSRWVAASFMMCWQSSLIKPGFTWAEMRYSPYCQLMDC
jgi:hypothetical protein